MVRFGSLCADPANAMGGNETRRQRHGFLQRIDNVGLGGGCVGAALANVVVGVEGPNCPAEPKPG